MLNMANNELIRFSAEVSRIMPDIMRDFLRRQTKEVTEGNISLPQVLILDVLKDHASMRMGELAKYLSVTMAAATGIVDKLVRSGLVTRGSSADDRRIVNISITSGGRRIIKKHNEAKQKAFMDIFGHLSAEDRAKYLEILTKVRQHLKKDGHS